MSAPDLNNNDASDLTPDNSAENDTTDATVEETPEKPAIVRATMNDVGAIVANPAKYGVSFPRKPIHSGTGTNKVVLRTDCPRVEVADLPTFIAYFGEDVVADSMNGTSTYIKGENMARALIVKDRKVTNDAIVVELVKRVLLATPAPRGGFVKKYTAVDGSEFLTLLDAQKHSMVLMLKAGITAETAKKLLGIG